MKTAKLKKASKIKDPTKILSQRPMIRSLLNLSLIGVVASSNCNAVPKANVGCYDLETLLVDGITTVESALGTLDPSTKHYIDKVQPMINLAIQGAHSSLLAETGVANILNTGFCVQSGLGSSFKDKSLGAPPNADYMCSKLALVEDDNYVVLSLGIATDILEGFCPGVDLNQMAKFCFAYSTCGELPTAAFIADKNFVTCSLANEATLAVSAGLSDLAALVTKFGLGSVGGGISPTADLGISEFKVWNMTNEMKYPVNGQYWDTISIDIDPLADALGLPKDTFAFDGTQSRMVKFGTIISSSLSTALINNPQTALNIANIPQFQVASVMSLGMTIKISSLCKGLPDMGPIELASMFSLATSFPKSDSNILQMGLYFYAETSDVIKTIMGTLLNYVNGAVGFLLDTVLPSGMHMDDMISAVDSLSSEGFAFAVTLNLDGFGFLIKFPLVGLQNAVSIECHVDYITGSKFSCSVDSSGLQYFITAIEDAGIWVAHEATAFFETTGNVIAAIAVADFQKVGTWTKNAEQATLNKIVSGELAVANYIKTYAATKGKACMQYIKDEAVCGFQTVTSYAQCGGNIVTSAASCGVTAFTDAVKCGSTFLADAAHCGLTTITDAGICGVDLVTDAAICGYTTAANLEKCGQTYVTSASVCGESLVTSASQCGSSIVSCIENLFSGCSVAKSCHVPNSCYQTNTCKFVGTCNKPKSCSTPAKCNVPNTCSLPNSCNVPLTCNVPAGCWKSFCSTSSPTTSSGSGGTGPTSAGVPVTTSPTPTFPPQGTATYTVNFNLTLTNSQQVSPQMIADFQNATASVLQLALSQVTITASGNNITILVSNLPSKFSAFTIGNLLKQLANNKMWMQQIQTFPSLVSITSLTASNAAVVTYTMNPVDNNAAGGAGSASSQPNSLGSSQLGGIIGGGIAGVALFAIVAFVVVQRRRSQSNLSAVPSPKNVEMKHNPLNDVAKDELDSRRGSAGLVKAESGKLPSATAGHWTQKKF